ncbi:MAG: hypothetical protein AAGI07_15860 [Bacteroidota bacterium]
MDKNNKYKININKPVPSEQELNKYKNFNRVLHQYRRSSHRKMQPNFLQRMNRYIPVLILAIIVLIFVLIFKMINEDTENNKKVPSPNIEMPIQ